MTTFTAWKDNKFLVSGGALKVAMEVRAALDQDKQANITIYDNATKKPVKLDLSGTNKDIIDRYLTVPSWS